jgi:hypothetical protein
MARLEDLKRDEYVRGVMPDALFQAIDVKWIGNTAVELFYKDPSGRAVGAATVTLTSNEINTDLNLPDHLILALVSIDGGQVQRIAYVRRHFNFPSDFDVTSVNYNLNELWSRAEEPA